MPRLGWTMEVGRVVEWLKNDGDPVEEGDIILAIESDKAVNEVEAIDSGILRIPADPQIGVELPVGAPLGFIVKPGDPDPFAGAPQVAATNDEQPAALVDTGVSAPVATTPVEAAVSANGHGVAFAISPRARRAAQRLGIDPATIQGTGSTGRIRERDVLAAAASRPIAEPVRAAPSVRQLADVAGIDLTTVPPGRLAGRVTRMDVLNAARRAVSAPIPGAVAVGPVRRVVMERMMETVRTVAPVTLTTDCDVTELVRIRDSFKAELGPDDGPVPSYNDMLIRLVALALQEHPSLNASLTDTGIVEHEHVHIGLAVDLNQGLRVPVVRDADRKSVHQIAEDTATMIAAIREDTIAPEQLRGSTFTVTSLGPLGIDAFTPLINLPEAAILGLGRIQSHAVVVNDDTSEIAVRKMMALSLTFDHRIVDGSPAARFLQNVVRKIERPLTWLTR
jgi:pyruvate dehydrogenase E2 component (dihydrolipoamide acetyltransferase)